MRFFLVTILSLVFCSGVSAQETVQTSLDDAEFVETDIDIKTVLSAREAQMEEPMDDPAMDTASMEPVLSVEPKMSSSVALREMQIIGLNQTLKNIIEQNNRLRSERNELEEELRFMRGQRRIIENRMRAVSREMNLIQAQTEGITELNQRYSRQVVDLTRTLQRKENEYQLKIKELEEKIPETDEMDGMGEFDEMGEPLAMASPGKDSKVISARSVEVDVVSMMEQFAEESDKLKRDTAKVHYNMGNIFFRKGEFKKASAEYRKVLKLVPADAAAHFNLAFVSGEHLSDPVTALKHYREYLLLSPDAPDAPAVEEKILEATLAVRTLMDSPLDRIPK